MSFFLLNLEVGGEQTGCSKSTVLKETGKHHFESLCGTVPFYRGNQENPRALATAELLGSWYRCSLAFSLTRVCHAELSATARAKSTFTGKKGNQTFIMSLFARTE